MNDDPSQRRRTVARPVPPPFRRRPDGQPAEPICADCGTRLSGPAGPIAGLCGLCYANRLVHGTR